jgi:hypothetical protein
VVPRPRWCGVLVAAGPHSRKAHPLPPASVPCSATPSSLALPCPGVLAGPIPCQAIPRHPPCAYLPSRLAVCLLRPTITRLPMEHNNYYVSFSFAPLTANFLHSLNKD